jgi:hypothetical protein|tara:strand:+ start:394 stop:1053 length:660 start_codon:yes stop_codon:yes gene_type:complete
MSHNYVKKMYNLSTTNATTVYTVPSEKTAFINSLRLNEISGNATSWDVTITDSSANVFSVYKSYAIAAGQEQELFSRNWILNEGDILKFTAATADRLVLHASILERDQGVNNKFIAKHNDYTTTDETTVYTVPAAKKAILSELWFSNDDTGNTIAATVKMYNSEGTAFILSEGTIAAGVSGEAMARPQIMDESEAIKVTAGTANRLHTHFSILEIGNPG